MKLGIFFSETNQHTGGGFQYEVSIANFLLKKLEKKNYKLKFYCTDSRTRIILKKFNINAVNVGKNRFFNFVYKINLFYNFKFLKRLVNYISPYEKFIKRDDLDLIYFLSPNHYAMYIDKCNYITTCWDICHRDNVEFPEIRKNYSFELREILFFSTYLKSQTVICDSLLTKKNLSKWYGVDNKRIKIIPLFRSLNQKKFENSNIESYVKTKKNYLFYPGQLWSHKNHIYVLNALELLKNKYEIKVDFYFCGSDKGNLKHINDHAKKLNIQDQVKYLGFLNNMQIKKYYENAFALIMPTYFGPSNYPPLEAFSYGCPVIYNLFGSEDINFKKAVWNINIKKISSLVEVIINMKKNQKEVKNKIKKGLNYFSKIDEKKIINEYEKIFSEFLKIKNTWKSTK